MINQVAKAFFVATVAVFIAGCEEEKTDFAAEFESSVNNIGIGQYVNFEDASIGAVTTYEWTFEGGEPTTASIKNPSAIRYDAAGSYDVTLTITTEEGTSTETKEDFIVVEQLAGGCGTTSIVTDIDGNS